MITVIRFVKPVTLGPNAEVVEHFVIGRTSIGGKSPTATFDKDDRFVRFDYAGAAYFDLIPFTNIASIYCVPALLNKPAASKESD